MSHRAVLVLLGCLACQTESLDRTAHAVGSSCEDTACAPPDAPQPLTGCDARGNPIADAILGARMLAAASCVGLNGGHMNGYGCFCGEGNTGVDTRPVDKIDGCCQQHDIDWHAICQNTPVTPGSTQGCNCYTNTPALTCNADHTLTVPAGLNACQKACGEELKKNTLCMRSNEGDWSRDHWQGNPLDRTPFDGPCPAYCKKGDAPPNSDFGTVTLPGNQSYPTCEPVPAPPEDAPPEDAPPRPR
jgi:hypothetical protein